MFYELRAKKRVLVPNEPVYTFIGNYNYHLDAISNMNNLDRNIYEEALILFCGECVYHKVFEKQKTLKKHK